MANVDIVIRTIDKTQGGLSTASKQTQGWAQSLKTAATNAATVTAAIALAGQAWNKTVVAAQAYDQKVYDMMLTTRGTAQETSKLIQVLDDTGVQYDTLKTAMKMAVKNGVEPNIESLAKLADQYVALKDPIARGQLLLDKFGKSGLEMGRAMIMGGDALRKMSSEMSGGLILTQANIDASEEYRKNLDELQDTADGVAVSFGNKVIPVLNDVLVVVKDTADELQNEAKWYEKLTLSTMLGVSAAELHRNKEIEAADAVASHGEALDGLVQSLDETTTSLEEQAAAAKATTDANNGLMSLAKTIQGEMDNYQTSVSDLSTEHYNLTQKLVELEAAGMKGTETWNSTTQALWENTNAMTALGTEHELQMKKIATDLLIAKLQADGFTEAEYKMAMQALISSGQIDQATADMVLGFEDAANAALRAKDSVVILGGKAKEIATDYFMNFIATLTINAKRVEYGSEGPDVPVPTEDYVPGPTMGNAYGGSWTIPQAYGNEGYNMGGNMTASGGETVTVSPRGAGNVEIIKAIQESKIDMNRLVDGIVRGFRDAMLQAGT